MLDDDLVVRHPQRALCQRHGADHRQELWRQANAQGHRKEQRLKGVVVERGAHQHDEQHQHDSRSKNQQAEAPQAVLELRFRRTGSQPHRDGAKQGLRASAERQGGGRAADHRGAEKDEMRGVWTEPVVFGCRRRVLVGGQRFASQHRLLDREVPRLEQAGVRRYEVTGGQPEDVARHDVPHGNSIHAPSRLTVAVGTTDDAKSLRGLLRAVGLPEVDGNTQHHHRDDDQGVGDLTE